MDQSIASATGSAGEPAQRRDECLDDDELELLANGLIPGDEQGARLERHIDACAACRRAAAVMLRTRGPSPPATARTPPVAFGRYVAIEVIGEGAMGRVVRAYDPKLGREVAIKFLRGAWDEGDDLAAVIAEARAMARLSHPNLVGVFDIGDEGAGPFIVMEYVRGETLAQWLRREPRSWREVLARFLEIAEGLAAAHAAGIVHRDLKPANILIATSSSATGECARVTDFGLAQVGALPRVGPTRRSDAASLSQSDGTETADGVVAGTPAYMAPEQHAGQPVEPSADQYAFGVALYEALYGVRPFHGARVDELLRAKLRLAFADPGERRLRVPRWLHDVVTRALAVDPADRWPSMRSLALALQRGHHRSRWRRASAVLGGLALMGAGFVGADRLDDQRRRDGCLRRTELAQALWNDGARDRVHTGLLATGAGHAPETSARVIAALDRRADALGQALVDVCWHGEVEHAWSADEVAVASRCLEERQIEFGALVDQLVDADLGVAHGAIAAAAWLDGAGSCADPVALLRAPQPPSETTAEVRALKADLMREQVRAVFDLHGDERLVAATSLRSRAEALGWPPMIARARAHEARLLSIHDDEVTAEQAGTKAYFEASSSDAWDVAAMAATQLAKVLGDKLGRFEEALVWGEHARMAIAHADDSSGTLDVALARVIGKVRARQGRYDEARELARYCLAHVESAHGPDHPAMVTALDELASIEHQAGDQETALALGERAVALAERSLGPSHPHLFKPLAGLALAREQRGEFGQARALHERALAVATVLGEESLDLAALRNNSAGLDLAMGDFDAARAKYELVVESARGRWGGDHPALGAALTNLGTVLASQGDHDGALRKLEEARVILERRLGPDHVDVGIMLGQLARISAERGDLDGALRIAERAVEIHERALGTEHPNYAASAADLGDLLDRAGQKHRALRLLEAAVRVFELHPGVQPGERDARAQLERVRADVSNDEPPR